jgi:hypothetical protein
MDPPSRAACVVLTAAWAATQDEDAMRHPAVSAVLVESSALQVDDLRRALWLPRRPDARRTLDALLSRAAHPGTLAFTAHRGHLLVHGLSAVAMRRFWLDLSRDGPRVLAFRLTERLALNWWCVYEQGRVVRQVDERTGRDFGGRQAFEPPRSAAEAPSDRIRVVYRGLAGCELEHDFDPSVEVDVWNVQADGPAPRRAEADAPGAAG